MKGEQAASIDRDYPELDTGDSFGLASAACGQTPFGAYLASPLHWPLP